MSALAETYLRQARSFLLAGDPKRSVELLKKARALCSKEPQLLVVVLKDLCNACKLAGRNEDAGTYFMQLQALLGPTNDSEIAKPAAKGGRVTKRQLMASIAALVLLGVWLAARYRHNSANPQLDISAANLGEDLSTRERLLRSDVGLVAVVGEYSGDIGGSHCALDCILGSGSCFAIRSDDYMLTNRHVVDASAVAPITLANAGLPQMNLVRVAYVVCFGSAAADHIPAEVFKTSPRVDLAVLRLHRHFPKPLDLATQTPHQGDDVFSAGYPGAIIGFLNQMNAASDQDAKVRRQLIQTRHLSDLDLWDAQAFTPQLNKGIVSVGQRVLDDIPFLQFDGTIAPGNSGGPVLDVHNHVVGMVTFKPTDPEAAGNNFAIAAQQLHREIDLLLPAGTVASEDITTDHSRSGPPNVLQPPTIDGPVADKSAGPAPARNGSDTDFEIRKTLLGELPKQMLASATSNDGCHVAWVGKEGDEFVVVHDGHVTGKYESWGRGSLLLSPDGKHLAFVDNHHVVLDGKPEADFDGIQKETLVFSPDSKRLGYVGWRASKAVVVLDGNESGEYQGVVDNSLTFSANSKHFAYAISVDSKSLVVVDGRSQPEYDGIGRRTITFSRDGGHLAYTAALGQKRFVVLDGQPQPQYDGISEETPVFSFDGKRWAYAAGALNRQYIIVDAKVEGEYNRILVPPTFSPDGKRVAFAVQEGSRHFVVVDGQPEIAFEGIGNKLTFSPDGKHLAYVAANGFKQLVVLDGRPGPEVDGVGVGPIFSADGKHIAYGAGRESKSAVVLDGQRGTEYDGILSLTFSPDGRQLAFGVKDGAKCVMIVDRHPGPAFEGIVKNGPVAHPDGTIEYLALDQGTASNMCPPRPPVDWACGTPT